MSEIVIDTKEIAQKLYNNLSDTGWDNALRTYLLGDSFQVALSELVKLRNQGKRITPPLKNIFRAFKECPLDTLKVVVIGQDPYPKFGVGDGISFSCSNNNYPEASLRYMLKEIERTVDEEFKDIDPHCDLKRWSNQGVLMLNTALTTNVGEIGKHYHVWNDFTAELLDYLGHNLPNTIYVMLGKKAQEWKEFIPESETKIYATHPASAAYNKQSTWNSENLFNKINQELIAKERKPIIW